MNRLSFFDLIKIKGGSNVVAQDRCTALQNLINENAEDWKKNNPGMIDEWADAYEYWCMNP